MLHASMLHLPRVVPGNAPCCNCSKQADARHCRRRHRRRVHVAASNVADFSDVRVPQSLEEVLEGAGLAVQSELDRLAPKSKSFKRGQPARLAVEVAVADQSPEGVAALAAGLLAPLEPATRATCKLAFHDVEAALRASDQLADNDILSVQNFQPMDQAGLLLVVGVPTGKEQEAASLAKWRGNLVWVSTDMNSLAYQPTPLRQGFQTVYAFEPFAAKGLVRTTEGLILKQPAAGKAGGWLILKKAGGWGAGGFRVVGRTPQRPTASDVELSLYNSSAAESPLVRGIKALRGLAPGGKGGG